MKHDPLFPPFWVDLLWLAGYGALCALVAWASGWKVPW